MAGWLLGQGCGWWHRMQGFERRWLAPPRTRGTPAFVQRTRRLGGPMWEDSGISSAPTRTTQQLPGRRQRNSPTV